MDIPRKNAARNRRIRQALVVSAVVVVVALISLGVSRLEPALPSVDEDTVWIGKVERGPMVRQVRGPGTLVPETILWIPAATEGRVRRVLVLPGSAVEPDTVLLELTNPDLELAALEAEAQYRASEAEYNSLRVQLQSQLLTQEAATASVEAEHRQAELQAAADTELAAEGLIADLTLKLSQVREKELVKRASIERRRLDISAESIQAQLDAQRTRVDQFLEAARLRRRQVDDLQVRAGIRGVLQQLPLEAGQRVTPGTDLAKVAEPGRLKAEVRIAETQARDVAIGQLATIDTRNGVVEGRVIRIDPAVQNGTVTVDVALVGELPRGARPDQSVDGTIELERLDDVLYIGRPAFGQEHGTIGLFRLGADDVGERVQVELGRSSVSTIEVVGGLAQDDRVILSDMSTWDDYDRVRLN